MVATEQLKEEHKGIKLGLRILDKMCAKLEAEEPVAPEHLDEILEFIRVFADKCHHGKEEDLLFPAMEQAGIPREGGPIGVMLIEHDTGREYVRGLAEGIEGYKAGDSQAAAKIVENARGYIALLTQHIDKEDNILYMMADMHLSPEQDAELVVQFEKVELERIGPGKHEEFHRMLDRLEAEYLK